MQKLLPHSISQLINLLTSLPGVGEKTALRYALQMSRWTPEQILSLSESIKALLDLQKCDECGAYSDQAICIYCSDPVRQKSGHLCVVESFSDYLAILKSGEFRGLLHILGGVLNPLLGIGPQQLTIDKLLSRIKSRGIQEVVLALNPSVEGDITSTYIRELLGLQIKVERIGLGIPMGGSLEYLDALTIGKALENRKSL